MKNPINLKVLTAVLFCITLSSCNLLKVIKVSKKQKIEFKDTKISFDIVQNRILLKDGIDFMLDIAAPNAVFLNSKDKFNYKDSVTIGHLENAKGEKIENKLFVINQWENKMFNSSGLVVRQIPHQLNRCLGNVDGLLGNEIFVNGVLHLNFSSAFIQRTDNKTYNSTDYTELKVAKFDGYNFFVELLINGAPVSLLLDTGSYFGIILNEKTRKDLGIDFLDSDRLSYISENDFVYFIEKQIRFNKESTLNKSAIILAGSKMKRNSLGVQFMKNYDWILDYQNGKVFLRPFKEPTKTIYRNRVVEKEGELLVNYVENKHKTLISNKITKVNGTKVMPDNLCEIMELLNESENWDEFTFESNLY